MKVYQLIAELGQYDGNADVLFVSQPSWPFEYSISHVMSREEISDDYEAEEREFAHEHSGKTDVILVEGDQLRYGAKACWSR